MAVPQNHLVRFNIETTLDSNYRDAVLKVWTAMAFRQGAGGRVNLTLQDAGGRTIAVTPSSVELTRSNPETILEIPIAAPRKWDAEHPNLYTLQASVTDGANVVETVSRTFGFRQIQRAGRRLLVNGKEVKLRGVDRHDIDPVTGRAKVDASRSNSTIDFNIADSSLLLVLMRAKIAAAIIGSAAFFEPLQRTSPCKATPPAISKCDIAEKFP